MTQLAHIITAHHRGETPEQIATSLRLSPEHVRTIVSDLRAGGVIANEAWILEDSK